MVFYAAFNSISVISRRQLTLFMSFLGFTSTRLGSEVSCPRTIPRKDPDNPVWLEPRTSGLRVKHFTTEPHGTLESVKTDIQLICLFSYMNPLNVYSTNLLIHLFDPIRSLSVRCFGSKLATVNVRAMR